ncbi:MAG: serine hydrolase [Rhodospirillales bacterium]|nr:serine hydrolase [Rhodospirillales bacterium]
MAPNLRRLAAIVAADVVGYSRLMGRDESGTLVALKTVRRDIIDPRIEAFGGRIVKTTGDGMLLEFPSVVDAVRCVVEIQTAVAAHNAGIPEDRRIIFRVGVNLGDIIIEGDDIFGDGVNVAGRLQEMAAPGGVCLSNRVHDEVRDRLDLVLDDGGEQILRNIARPVHIWHWSPANMTPSRERDMSTPRLVASLAPRAARRSIAFYASMAAAVVVLAGTAHVVLSPKPGATGIARQEPAIDDLGKVLAAAQEKAHPWPTRKWPTSSPEEQGMSSDTLARLVDFGSFSGMDSLLVTRHGRIVLEASYAPFRADLKHRLNSATKSVVGSLVGIALKDGLLDSTDRRVLDFFSDSTIAALDERKKAMTIRHLLDMTSGIEWSEPFNIPPEATVFSMVRSPNWQQFVLDRRMSAVPGTVFNYDSGNSHLLSAILTKITGKSTLDYAREVLFGPLGIEDVLWQHDPQGISVGAAGLYLQPRDMAKIGYLYLRNGMWEGKQILPWSWTEGVRRTTVDVHESWSSNIRYGSQFWVIPSRDVYMAIGYHQQLIVVMPKLDIVVVATGSARFPARGGAPDVPRFSMDTLVGHVMAAVKSDAPIPADRASMAHLADRLRDVATEQPAPGGGSSELAKAVSGKLWRFPDNPLRIKWITLTLDEPQPSYEFELDGRRPGLPGGRFGGPIGFDGQTRVGGRMPYGLSAARGTWLADGTSLVLEFQTLGNDDAARVTHVFGAKTIEVSFESANGFRAKLQGQADD